LKLIMNSVTRGVTTRFVQKRYNNYTLKGKEIISMTIDDAVVVLFAEVAIALNHGELHEVVELP
jgi:hypothetical protein